MKSPPECQETSPPNTQEVQDKEDQKMPPGISHEEKKELEAIEGDRQVSLAAQLTLAENLNLS